MNHVPELGDLVLALECIRGSGGDRNAACILQWSLGTDAGRYRETLDRIEHGLASVLDADRLELEFDSVLRQRASIYRQEVEQTVFPLSFRWFWLAASQEVAASYAWFQEWLSSHDEMAAYKAACLVQDHAVTH
ncbi:MAG: hypothetical protein HZB71_05615 [Betaproteobacteria bacterium]|nr:hypothetical protein [Betaproteobacteria bacterium]